MKKELSKFYICTKSTKEGFARPSTKEELSLMKDKIYWVSTDQKNNVSWEIGDIGLLIFEGTDQFCHVFIKEDKLCFGSTSCFEQIKESELEI